MMTHQDVAEYFRDIFYLQEQALVLLKDTKLPKQTRDRVRDNIVEKQLIITKIFHLILYDIPEV